MSAARFPHFYPVMETMRSRPAMTSHDQLWPGKESPESLTNKLQIDQRTKVGPDTFHGGRVYWNIEDKEVGMNQVTISYLWPMKSAYVWLCMQLHQMFAKKDSEFHPMAAWGPRNLQIDHCRAHMDRAGPLATVWHFSAADRRMSYRVMKLCWEMMGTCEYQVFIKSLSSLYQVPCHTINIPEADEGGTVRRWVLRCASEASQLSMRVG